MMGFGVAALALFLLVLWVVNQLPSELPRPSGAFPVGRTIQTWVDRSAPNELAPAPETDRTLVAWMWYPASARSGTPAPYLPAQWRDAFGRSGGFVMARLLTRNLAKVRVHSLENAPLAPDPQQYPVVLLLPGSSALAAGYTALAEDLASHGYVVVGLNAPYLTTVVVLPDGRVVYRSSQYDLDSASSPGKMQLAERLVKIWSRNVDFALANLSALSAADSDSQFAGHLDLQRLGIVGHSLGGAVALDFCRQDPRCKAGIDLDGRLFGSLLLETPSQPFMFALEEAGRNVDAETADILAQIHSTYARLPAASRFGMSISGANHFTFSDQLLVKNPLLVKSMQLTGIIKLDGARGSRITADFVRTYFDVHLEGTSRAELDDLARKYPEVRVW
jgi:predicted dienelactone hydrolase